MTEWSWLSFIAGAVAVAGGLLLLCGLVVVYLVVMLIRRGKQERATSQVTAAMNAVKDRFPMPPPPPAA